MTDLTDLPTWVWELLDALNAYEAEHPILYRMTASDEFERAQCFGSFLSESDAWPPREISEAAAFRRHVLKQEYDELERVMSEDEVTP